MRNRPTPLRRTALMAAALLVLPLALSAQVATVTGRVTNESGQPVVGAVVTLPSLGLGATSREDGRYTITVPAGRVTGQVVTLRARRVGFQPVSIPITVTSGTVVQDVTLTTSPLRLQEVVVTGAGTSQARERLGNVVNTVDSAMIGRASQPQNVVSALAGTTPNVQVRTQSGEPGSSAYIQIRGATSVLGTNQPLFVVDDQPIDNTTVSTGFAGASTVSQNRAADLNPNDIESIQILKGAAASAIYGARGANGVILVTTKRGSAGPTRYTLASTSTFDEVTRTVPLQTRWAQGSSPRAAATCSGVGCRLTSLAWGPLLPPGTPVFNHSKEIFRTGMLSDNNLSIAGGTGRTTFFLSGGRTGQLGVLDGPNNKYTRTSIRLKASHQLVNNLTVGGNFTYLDTRGAYTQKGSNLSGLLLGALRTPPAFDNRQYLDPVTGVHRSYRYPQPASTSLYVGRGYDNPFFILNNPGNRSELGRFVGNVSLDYIPSAWFALRYTLGADNYADSRTEALPLTSSSYPTGQVTRFTIDNLEIDHNLTATFSRDFGDAVQTRLLVGQNLNSRRNRQVYVVGSDLVAPEPFSLQNTLSWTPSESKSLRHIESYFSQLEADFYSQLFLTLGLRNDGFSTFGASNRRANYPKASVAWTFTTPFRALTTGDWLSVGKLRAAYGETGREPPVYGSIVQAYSSTTLFGSGYGDLISGKQSGQSALSLSTTIGNDKLRPERNRELELGTDLGLFSQRADLSFTWYDRQSRDVILYSPINAAANGATQSLVNAASISNKGIEAILSTRLLDRERYGLEVAVNYARNRGKVLSLLPGTTFVPYNSEGFTGALGSSTVGFAPGVIRGFDFARCGRGQKIDIDGSGTLADIDALCGAGAKKDALFLGADGLPVLNPDEQVIGDPNPRWTGGASTTLRYGKFSLSTLFDVRRGGDVWNGTKGALYFFGAHGDLNDRETPRQYGKNYFTRKYPNVAGPGAGKAFSDGPQGLYDWIANGQGSGFGDVSAQFVEDGSFVKWRELSLTYRMDQRWLRERLGIATADLRIAGRNLRTWTRYTGLDPESNLGGAEWLTQGLDYFNNPQTRSFVVGVTLTR
ncbi:MAG: SusC/RagA family TonB-linked outer membrane protein [Gemmatimonadaceae bacterium]